MKPYMKSVRLAVVALAMAALPLTAAPVSTAFTYQGSLKKAGQPVSAPQDFQFGLYSAATGSPQIGTTVTLTNVTVTNGLFNVNLDFGAAAFGTEQRYLQIMVRSTGETAYTGLAPRAPVMPAPVALSVASGGVSNAAIQDGTITRDKLAPTVLPKVLTSLTSDFLIPPGTTSYVPFSAPAPSPNFAITPTGVEVLTAGTYVVTAQVVFRHSSNNIFAHLTVNRATIRTLWDLGNHMFSGMEIRGTETLYLKAGDLISVRVRDTTPGGAVVGNDQRDTFLDVIRLD
jgi:hypothetical protein